MPRGVLPPLPLWLFCTFLLASPGAADEVTVKGVVLRGSIIEVTAESIVFETEYGEGSITIPFDTIDALVTEGSFLILYGDDGEISGRLLGVREGRLLVGTEPINLDTIVRGSSDTDLSGYDRFRNDFRHWHAELSLGIGYKASTTDEVDVAVGFRVERIKNPARLLAEINWIYENEKKNNQDRSTTDNEIRGLVKAEHRFSERWFGYTSHDGEYDELDNLSLRYVGKVGPGYWLLKNDDYYWQIESGIGYAYDRFFGGDREEFAALPIGTEAMVKLPGGATFRARADYLPSLQDWTGDYLLRADASLTVPIDKSLSLKASILETYDSTPDPGSEKNELKFLFGLALHF